MRKLLTVCVVAGTMFQMYLLWANRLDWVGKLVITLFVLMALVDYLFDRLGYNK